MNGKRQKQIKAFLVEEFGEEKGGELFGKQTKTLDELIKTQKNKSARQMKTLAGTILPCIALYKTLSTDGLSQEAAYVYMRAYMLDKAAAQKHGLHGGNGSRVGLLRHLQPYLSERHAQERLVGKHAAAREKFLRRHDSKMPVAYGLRRKRLPGAVPPVLRFR